MSEQKESDYQKGLNAVKPLPTFYLGQEVETKDGKGIIVRLSMEFNGLYLSPERSEAVVWYSTSKAFDEGITWVSFTYRLSELSPANITNQ